MKTVKKTDLVLVREPDKIDSYDLAERLRETLKSNLVIRICIRENVHGMRFSEIIALDRSDDGFLTFMRQRPIFPFPRMDACPLQIDAQLFKSSLDETEFLSLKIFHWPEEWKTDEPFVAIWESSTESMRIPLSPSDPRVLQLISFVQGEIGSKPRHQAHLFNRLCGFLKEANQELEDWMRCRQR